MDTQSSSRAVSSTAYIDFQNKASNMESARFLKRILVKSEQERKQTKLPDALDRAYFFTGMDKRLFPSLATTTTAADLSKANVKDIERSLIQERLIAFYLNASRVPPRQEMVPTTRNLYAALYGQIPYYVDIRTFRKYLAKLGYVWLKIPKGYIVMERPSVTFDRYYYLRDLVKYREEGREIFYVDETVLTDTACYYSLKEYHRLIKTADKADVEIDQKGLVKNIYAVSKTGVHAYKNIKDFTRSNYADWIIKDLLPALPEKSVVVVTDCEYHDDKIKKPTLYSLKADIIEWLERNNVPYDEHMSKCELVSLVDSYTTESDETSQTADSLKIAGHILLRLPVCIEHMTTAKHVFDLIKLNVYKSKVQFEKQLKEIIGMITTEMLDRYDNDIAELETVTLHLDVKLDEVFDYAVKEMQEVVRLKDAEDSEVPLSDSD